MKKHSKLRVAIVHDNFKYFGGAERVVLALHRIWPHADVYTSTISWDYLRTFKNQVLLLNPQTSWAQRIPFFPQYPFLYRYLLPLIWWSFDFSKYDVVISSSYAQMSHLIRVPAHVLHICYSHSPPRHLYGYETDFDWERIPAVRFIANILNPLLRRFDYQAAQRVSSFIACSQEVAKRIMRFYNQHAVVIYPPCLLGSKKLNIFTVSKQKGRYFLVVSRLSRRKHIDLVVRTCTRHNIPLIVAGKGPEEYSLKQIAGPSIYFVGEINVGLSKYYKGCKAVICTGKDEESSIVPIEALYHRKPVIAYRSGGYSESVVDGKTGILFTHLTEQGLLYAIKKAERLVIDKETAVMQLRKFSLATFENKITDLVLKKTHEHTLLKS